MSEQAGVIVIIATMAQFFAALLFAAWQEEKGYQMGYKHGYQDGSTGEPAEPSQTIKP